MSQFCLLSPQTATHGHARRETSIITSSTLELRWSVGVHVPTALAAAETPVRPTPSSYVSRTVYPLPPVLPLEQGQFLLKERGLTLEEVIHLIVIQI